METRQNVRENLIATAAKYIGVTEVGPDNRGRDVDRFLTIAGTATGQPWCAAFVYAVTRQAGYHPGVRWPASCRSWVAWGIEHRAVRTTPRRGDLVVFDWDGDGPDDHIGFVEKVHKVGPVVSLTTIEGNTRVTGKRRDGVYRRTRVIRRSRVVFIDPTV